MRIIVLTTLALVVLCGPAFAADDRISLEGISLDKPSGWVEAKSGSGVLLALHVAGQKKTRIEIRTVSQMDDGRARSFFSSFHSNLQSAGLQRLTERSEVRYGALAGTEIEYLAESRRSKYRLIVWQVRHDDRAYIITGFFPEAERDERYQEFQQLLSRASFE